MDPRYQHPVVTALWSPEWTYDAWWRIEKAVARAQIEALAGEPPTEQFNQMQALIGDTQPDFTTGAAGEIREIEGRTRHDVAAFLEFVRGFYGEPHARWIHYGLTSSDLVDTAQGMRFKEMERMLRVYLEGLERGIDEWRGSRQVVVGRTHGQPAEPITMGMRAESWGRMLNEAGEELLQATGSMQLAKTSGPVGSFAHNGPWIELKVAIELGLVGFGQGATQIIPRTYLARWASAASQVVQVCAKIAMDLRLMLVLNEGRESNRPRGQVGSSSMAHKTNPVGLEQITGLARLAAGYANMLQPLDIWLERDISHSSVERVAVPDLWHVLLHVLAQTGYLLSRFETGYRADLRLASDLGKLTVHRRTLDAVKAGESIGDARTTALLGACGNPLLDSTGQMWDLDYYSRNWNYPS